MNKKSYTVILIIVLVIASFFAGSYMKEQENYNARMQRCVTLLTFAIDKVENHDLRDPNVMETLISNIYAAYEMCDDVNISGRLHDLWNKLIFEPDGYIEKKDLLAINLRSIVEAIELRE